MKYVKIVTVIAACLLMTGIFTAVPAFSVQPPLDPSTYYIGTIGQPQRLDPARAYDTASGELIQNVMQPLIWFANKHPITFNPGEGYNLTLADYADLTQFKPILATTVPTETNGGIVPDGTGGSYWTFTINTNALWQSWVAANGSLIAPRNITAADVVYSFQRMMVIEMSSSPNWMFFMPAFGYMGFRYKAGMTATTGAYSNGTWRNPANSTYARDKIINWCYASGGNNVTFHFEYAWTAVAMYQIFAQTWGCVVNPEFTIEHGDWDGLFPIGASAADMTGDWSNYYRRKPATTTSPLDIYKNPATYGAAHASKYASGNHDVPCLSGTGPYNFTSTDWDQTTKTWRINKNENYWMGWDEAGDQNGNYIHSVIEKGIDSYPTRKMLFLEGEFDVAVIPRANMYDMLDSPSDPYTPIAGVNLVYNIASLSNDMLLFTFNLSETSAYQSYVGYPTHIGGPAYDFFANEYVRQAFAWALDYTSYVHDAWFDEALVQQSWWVDGLSPAAAKNTNTSMPQRNYDLTQMRNALNQAIVDGQNVSDKGFEVTLCYNIGNDQRLIACQLFQQAFTSLGAKYKVNVVGLDLPVFLDARDAGDLAAYDVGWLADFAHPDNFARPYQHSQGDFMYTQTIFPPDQAIIDAEIDAAIIEPNLAAQIALYQDLQYRYWLDATAIPEIQPVGRRFARDWVQGWYFNSLFPGLYAYDIYKAISGTVEPINLDITSTVTPLTTYPKVYISDGGQMKVLYGGGQLASMTFNVSVKRIDVNNLVPSLITAIGLERINLTDLAAAIPLVTPPSPAYPTSTLVLVGPSTTVWSVLTWYEDGTDSTLQANATWQIWGLTAVGTGSTAYDTNMANNNVSSGFSTIAYVSTDAGGGYNLIVGDINGDAVVNILDAIQLSNSFGKSFGQTGYNPAADINSDGTVNILDAILLSNHFNQKAIVA